MVTDHSDSARARISIWGLALGEGRKEGRKGFNDALSTFYYGYMVKDNSDSERAHRVRGG